MQSVENLWKLWHFSPEKFTCAQKPSGSSQTPWCLPVGVGDTIPSAPWLAIPAKGQASLHGGSAWLAPGTSNPGSHTAGPGPSKGKGLTCVAKLTRFCSGWTQPSLIPLEMSTLLCGKIIWGKFKICSAFIYTFIYSMPERKRSTFHWVNLVIACGGRLGSELPPYLFTRWLQCAWVAGSAWSCRYIAQEIFYSSVIIV